jgi:hypothetical protein
MLIRYQKAYIVALNWLSTQNNEIVGTLCHETREFVTKNAFDVISLFDRNGQANRIDRAFNQYFLVSVT